MLNVFFLPSLIKVQILNVMFCNLFFKKKVFYLHTFLDRRSFIIQGGIHIWIHHKPQNSIMWCSRKTCCISGSSHFFSTYKTAAHMKADVKRSCDIDDWILIFILPQFVNEWNVLINICVITVRGILSFTRWTQYLGEYIDRIFNVKLTLLWQYIQPTA